MILFSVLFALLALSEANVNVIIYRISDTEANVVLSGSLDNGGAPNPVSGANNLYLGGAGLFETTCAATLGVGAHVGNAVASLAACCAVGRLLASAGAVATAGDLVPVAFSSLQRRENARKSSVALFSATRL